MWPHWRNALLEGRNVRNTAARRRFEFLRGQLVAYVQNFALRSDCMSSSLAHDLLHPKRLMLTSGLTRKWSQKTGACACEPVHPASPKSDISWWASHQRAKRETNATRCSTRRRRSFGAREWRRLTHRVLPRVARQPRRWDRWTRPIAEGRIGLRFNYFGGKTGRSVTTLLADCWANSGSHCWCWWEYDPRRELPSHSQSPWQRRWPSALRPSRLRPPQADPPSVRMFPCCDLWLYATPWLWTRPRACVTRVRVNEPRSGVWSGSPHGALN